MSTHTKFAFDRIPRTNALSIRPQELVHLWQPSAQRAARGFFRPQRSDKHIRRHQHITALPRGMRGKTSQPPRISKGGGAIALIIFHFVDVLRVFFTMLFAMFSARLLEHFYRVFCKVFYNIFTGCSAGFFTTFLQGVLQGVFYDNFTRCFARFFTTFL